MYFPYIDTLIRANRDLGGSESFVFYPGMEFGSYEKWWPDGGMRPTSHEGIDFCYYLDASGEEQAVSAGLRVPVMAPGSIAAICGDYLGHTLFVEHDFQSPGRFLSVYAHTVPDSGIEQGLRLARGDVMAGIADTCGRKNKMPAHLHFTLMVVAEDVAFEMFDWDLINRSNRSKLLDPLEIIDSRRILRRSRNHWKKKMVGDRSDGP